MNIIRLNQFANKNKKAEAPLPLVLDVRRKGQRGIYSPGGYHIPAIFLETRLSEIEAHKKRPIVIVCSTSSMTNSKAAATLLESNGFENVSILSGGVYRWKTYFPRQKFNSIIEN